MSSAALRLRPFRGRGPVASRLQSRAARASAAEDGFLLIEVMVSALLVGLIALATFNGFAVANRFSADQRRHSEAELLAAQSQEQLRSDPATALDTLETAPHSYTTTVNGTEFTITQEAKGVNSAGSATGCTFSESSKEHGANVLITTAVTWSLLTKAKRPAVKQASIVTPPIGSALEVDVSNGGSPPSAVSGVTAVATFVPEGSGSSNTAQGTTGTAGCVVLSGLASTSATVEIQQKANFVSTGGLLQYPTKEVTIVPNLTTQYPVTYAEGGRLKAEFTYKGSKTFEGKTVTGDTFVVTNSSIPSGYTKFAVGGTNFSYGSTSEELYKTVPGTYSETALTAAGTKYTKGDLFPFPSGWSGYAGDCPKNDIGSEAESPAPGIVVTAGETKAIKIPLSFTKANVYVGTQKATGALATTGYPAVITDFECESYEAPLHASAPSVEHTQKTNTEGHLSFPFQPFGKATLCVEANGRNYTAPFNNTNATGSTVNLYLGEITNAEKAAAREKEETKTRETAEAKETTEEAAKIVTEEAEDKKWQKEEKEGKISRSKREEKEKNYKKARETEEKTKETTRIAAEAAARTTKITAENKEISEKTVTVESGSC
jgi:Tfp pilus assembly protein PilV/flagellar biosynthesis GTPase FlhF